MSTLIYYPTLENGPISWQWITFTGSDAKDFLHRLTTVHLRQMEPGTGAPGCFLTAQGKIRSYFYLWNLSDNRYAFELNGGALGNWKTNLLATIDQYTFGERIVLEDLTSALKCAWIFPSEAQLNQLNLQFPKKRDNETYGGQVIDSPLQEHPDSTIKICNHGTLNYGRVWLTLWGTPALLDQWLFRNYPNQELDLKPVSFGELEQWRVQAVQPQMDSEITESAVPLEIGLRSAIADNKGCYPGQEVIEKIVALGTPARRLVRIEGLGSSPQVGDRVLALDPNGVLTTTEIGTITTSVPSEKDYSTEPSSTCSSAPKNLNSPPSASFAALALIRKTHAKEGTPVGFLKQAQIRGTVVKIAPYV